MTGTTDVLARRGYSAIGLLGIAATVLALAMWAPAAHAAGAVTTRPSLPKPRGLKSTAAGTTDITVSWRKVKAHGIKGYELYVNRKLAGFTRLTHRDLTGLRCGTGYLITVRTRDTTRHHSYGASANVKTAACAAGTPGATVAPTSGAPTSSPVVSQTPGKPPVSATGTPSPPAPVTTASCPANPLQGAATPKSMTVADPANPCQTATGVVQATHTQTNGACHITLAPDAASQRLINPVNTSKLKGNIVAVVLKGSTLAIPAKSAQVEIFATWVTRTSATTGYNEPDPVWSIKVLSGTTAPCGPPAAPKTVPGPTPTPTPTPTVP